MKSERFYYGAKLRFGKLDVIVGVDDAVIATGKFDDCYYIPRVTVCGLFDEKTNSVSFGVARCSAKDRFTKRVGRDLALKRAKENPYVVVKLSSNKKPKDIFFETAQQIETDVLAMPYPRKF